MVLTKLSKFPKFMLLEHKGMKLHASYRLYSTLLVSLQHPCPSNSQGSCCLYGSLLISPQHLCPFYNHGSCYGSLPLLFCPAENYITQSNPSHAQLITVRKSCHTSYQLILISLHLVSSKGPHR